MKQLLSITVCLLVAVSLFSQRVKRKGTTPIDISKNKGQTGNAPVVTTFKIEQLNGKWQEVLRTYKNAAVSNFTDTNFLNFTSPGKVTRTGNNQGSIVGEAVIEPGNILLAAADVYTILSVNDSTLIMDNQEDLIHTFRKTSEFYFEMLGKLSVKQDEYKDPISIKINDVIGKWGVYRRQAKPGAIRPPVNIIRYLKITEKTGDDTAKGEITFYQSEESTTLPCTIKTTNAGIRVSAGIHNWDLFAYKADGKEFVFGDADLMIYFAKPL